MHYYGLIGYPLGHSFSPGYFKEKFLKENIKDTEYNLYPLKDVEEIIPLIQSTSNLKGLSVTIPYKESVIPYLDLIDPDAQKIGAVNTISIRKDNGKNTLIGYNTDYLGFTESIKSKLKNSHQNALVLGTGGSSKAVCYGLDKMGIGYQLVSRQPKHSTLTYKGISRDIITSHTIIINTTPLGMSPNADNYPDIPYDLLSPDHILFDLIYNPLETKFLALGKQHGAVTINGLEMLKIQADKAWGIWNNP